VILVKNVMRMAELEVDGECIGFSLDAEIHEMSRTTVVSPEAELLATGPGVVSEWTSFKIVGDNVDKNVRPSNQRIDHTKLSHCTTFMCS